MLGGGLHHKQAQLATSSREVGQGGAVIQGPARRQARGVRLAHKPAPGARKEMQYKRPWLWLLGLAPRQQLQLPLWLYALLGIPKTRISEYQLSV